MKIKGENAQGRSICQTFWENGEVAIWDFMNWSEERTGREMS